VKSACERINARETHRIRLAAADAEIVRQNRQHLSIPESLEISGDPSLPQGSAVFETTRGELDASAQTQLDEIQRGFTDLVQRRKR
jgi:flagellar biosynthesis/type III secretory pathway protein FliH